MMALNKTKLLTIAKINIKTIAMKFPSMKFSIPLKARTNEIRLFKK